MEFQQNDGEESTQQAPQRHAGVADRAAEVLLSRRGELGDQGAGGGDQRADTEAGDESHHAEHGGGTHQRGEEHADGEPRVGGEHDPAATEDVTDGSGEQGTEQHSQQGVAAQGPRDRGRDLPDLARVLQEGRHHRAIDNEVVTIEDQADGGEGDDPHHRSSASCVLFCGCGHSHLRSLLEPRHARGIALGGLAVDAGRRRRLGRSVPDGQPERMALSAKRKGGDVSHGRSGRGRGAPASSPSCQANADRPVTSRPTIRDWMLSVPS